MKAKTPAPSTTPATAPARPPAEILPYPLTQRRNLIARCAARMSELSPTASEKHLREVVRVQTDTMIRRGIAPELVKREVGRLEGAVRSKLWWMVLTPGGVA